MPLLTEKQKDVINLLTQNPGSFLILHIKTTRTEGRSPGLRMIAIYRMIDPKRNPIRNFSKRTIENLLNNFNLLERTESGRIILK